MTVTFAQNRSCKSIVSKLDYKEKGYFGVCSVMHYVPVGYDVFLDPGK